jgi:hypothetical protein
MQKWKNSCKWNELFSLEIVYVSLIALRFSVAMSTILTSKDSWISGVADFQYKCSIEKQDLNLVLNWHRSTESTFLPI